MNDTKLERELDHAFSVRDAFFTYEVEEIDILHAGNG